MKNDKHKIHKIYARQYRNTEQKNVVANELKVVVDEENDVVQFPDEMLDLFLLKISPTVLNIHSAGTQEALRRPR